MKKTILIFALLFSLAGCAFISQQKSAYDACKADPSCVQSMQTVNTDATAIASTVAAVIPNPAIAAASPVIGKVVGALAGVIAALILGNGILKKKQNPTP